MVLFNRRLEGPFRKKVGILMWGKVYCMGRLRWEGKACIYLISVRLGLSSNGGKTINYIIFLSPLGVKKKRIRYIISGLPLPSEPSIQYSFPSHPGPHMRIPTLLAEVFFRLFFPIGGKAKFILQPFSVRRGLGHTPSHSLECNSLYSELRLTHFLPWEERLSTFYTPPLPVEFNLSGSLKGSARIWAGKAPLQWVRILGQRLP